MRLPRRGQSSAYLTFPDIGAVARGPWIPVGVSVLIGVVVVSVLGWWKPVLQDDRPVRRWVWTLPVVMLVAILAGTNYGLISEKGLIRRVSGTILLPMLIHGLRDFGLLTTVVGVKAYIGSGLFIVADIVLAIVAFVRRHRIEPAVTVQPAG